MIENFGNNVVVADIHFLDENDGSETWELDGVVNNGQGYIFATHSIDNNAYIVGECGSIKNNELPTTVDSDSGYYTLNNLS